MRAHRLVEGSVRALAELFEPRGFVCTGLQWFQPTGELRWLVEAQPWRGGWPGGAKVALNWGAFVASLEDSEGGCVLRGWSTAHWGGRVMGADGLERWWEVADGDDPAPLAASLREAVVAEVLPQVDALTTEAELVRRWLEGQSTSPLEAKRLQCLALLLHRAGRRAEFDAAVEALEALPRTPFSWFTLRELRALRW